jgi:Mrp family chromosome partitioning ATPase
MLRRRARLPVLAEIAGPPEARAWSLRRDDFAGLERALPKLDGQRVVLVSGEGEEGAVAAIALAGAASAASRRTILVECDLTRPRLAAHIGLAATPGVHEYLRWEAEPGDVLQPVVLGGSAATGAVDPLVCVCGGRPATKAETLLGLKSFAHMVGKLREAYELTILIGAPALSEPGPCVAAARQADAVLAALPGGEGGGGGSRTLRAAITQLPVPALGAISIAQVEG